MRVQVKRPRANEMGGTGSVMFEYVDFLHFNFRGINLSHLRHLSRTKSAVQQRY